jgi:excisionase family DNA binding protein
MTPDEVCAELRIGKSYLWTMLRSGEIQSIKIGKLRRIPRSALDEWLTRQLHKETNEVVTQ